MKKRTQQKYPLVLLIIGLILGNILFLNSCDRSTGPRRSIDPLDVRIVIDEDSIATRDTTLRVTLGGSEVDQVLSMILSLDPMLEDANWKAYDSLTIFEVLREEMNVNVYGRFTSFYSGTTSVLSDSIKLDFSANIDSVEVISLNDQVSPGEYISFRLVANEMGTAHISFGSVIRNYRLEPVTTGIFYANIRIPNGVSQQNVRTTGYFTDLAGNSAEPLLAERIITITGLRLNPQIIGSLRTPWEICYGFWTDGEYCFVSDGLHWNIHIIKTTEKTRPGYSHQIPTGAWTVGMVGAGDYLYLANDESGITVFNIDSPDKTIQIGNAIQVNGNPQDTWVLNPWLVVATRYSGLKLLDIREPASPEEVFGTQTNIAGEHLYIVDSYAYIVGGGGLSVVDMSRPASMNQVAVLPFEGRPHQVDYHDNKLYVAVEHRNLSLIVIDISVPRSPRILRYFYHLGQVFDLAISEPYLYVCGGDGIRVANIMEPELPVLAVLNGIFYPSKIALSGEYLYVAGWNSFNVVKLFSE